MIKGGRRHRAILTALQTRRAMIAKDKEKISEYKLINEMCNKLILI